MSFRLCLVAFLSVFCTLAAAHPVPTTSPKCMAHDRSLPDFVSRFTNDVSFQRTRLVLPLVSRTGDNLVTEMTIELWSLADVKRLKFPLILSDKDRGKQDIEQSITQLPDKLSAQVFQGQREADSFLMTYKFSNFEGCWYLEEVDDESQ